MAIGETTCEILHLDLGPLSLDLLGLQIDLSRVVLDITAQAGAGNLLGNLLCAVAGLLDNPGGLARLLNQILSAPARMTSAAHPPGGLAAGAFRSETGRSRRFS